jgi:hypothetical protein
VPGEGSIAGRRGVVLALSAALFCLSAWGASGALAAKAPEGYAQEYSEGFGIGLNGYEYGQPLLNMQRLYQSNTSVTVPDQIGDAPVNQFSHFPGLSETKEGEIVSPNADTLYSVAWLSLKSQPVVIHVPASPGRFSDVPFYSPYEENFANIGEGASGQLAPGDYVIAGPGRYSTTEELDGMKVIHSPYDRVWLLPRTLVKDREDTAAAVALQAEMKLVPLKAYLEEGLAYTPPAPETSITQYTPYTVPGTQAGEDPLVYWTALGAALKQFKPPKADATELKLLRRFGIGPGLSPANDSKLGPGVLAGLRAAVKAGPEEISKAFHAAVQANFAKHNGWGLSDVGTYGTDYGLRAVVDQFGLAALVPNVAIYPFATTDRTGAALTGEKRYVVHFPASDFPVPVQGFWSLTMYSTTGFFVANPLQRYTLGDRSALHFEEDGSLNLYVQATEPTNEAQRANWLPSPAGEGFQLILRLYGLQETAIGPLLEGAPGAWTPPAILPCYENGRTANSIECAT